ncbi:MAG TPA: hypothetical protein VNW29_05120 [Candidatus Sulfotelmatobacter sp.]|jgi:hypothetical protein|nr:hypothetical protein [Candidatus Sulfotelmatobacter sp.]
MNNYSFRQLFNNIIPFIRKYGIFIAPLLLFFFFMFVLIFSFTRPQQQPAIGTTTTNTPSQSIVNSSSSNSPSKTQGEGLQDDEKKNMKMWSNIGLSDNDFAGLNATKISLPDGSIQYTYASDIPNRPNIIIVMNGLNIFQRTTFTNTPFNTDYYGQPDYIAKGSQYWGTTAITYIYLSKGIALIGDTSTNQLLEQILFQHETIDQFKQQDTDIIEPPRIP